jgi:hypothetical protein
MNVGGTAPFAAARATEQSRWARRPRRHAAPASHSSRNAAPDQDVARARRAGRDAEENNTQRAQRRPYERRAQSSLSVEMRSLDGLGRAAGWALEACLLAKTDERPVRGERRGLRDGAVGGKEASDDERDDESACGTFPRWSDGGRRRIASAMSQFIDEGQR